MSPEEKARQEAGCSLSPSLASFGPFMIIAATPETLRHIPPPPGPANDLGAVKSLINAPARHLEAQVRQYGDINSISLGPVRLHFVNHPELIKEIIQDNPMLLPRQKLAGRFRKRFGKSIPATAEGEEHRGQRRLLGAFFAREPIRYYRHYVRQFSRELGEQWQAGQVVDMRSEMAHLTARVVCSSLFSQDAGPRIFDILDRFHYAHQDFGLLPPTRAALVSVLRQGPAARQYEAEAQLDEFILDTVRQRRAGNLERDDVLGALMQAREADGSLLTDEMIRAHIVTLFWASLEATTEAISWTWHTLDTHPEIQERVLREIAAHAATDPEFAELESLVYTRQMISETLRLYPPFWLLSRVAAKPLILELNGQRYRVKANEMISVSQYLMNRDERYWEEPLRFDPERFAPGRADKISRSVFFPFGMGSHRCIGEMFSWMEVLTILTTLLPRWKASAAGETTVTMRSGVTMYAVGLNMKLERR